MPPTSLYAVDLKFPESRIIGNFDPVVSQNPVNEMVRRLVPTLKWMILLAGLRRIIDMQIRSVGIDLGKTTFHLVALSAPLQITTIKTLRNPVH